MKEDCFLTCLSKNIDLVVLDLQEKKIHREIYEQQDTFLKLFADAVIVIFEQSSLMCS